MGGSPVRTIVLSNSSNPLIKQCSFDPQHQTLSLVSHTSLQIIEQYQQKLQMLGQSQSPYLLVPSKVQILDRQQCCSAMVRLKYECYPYVLLDEHRNRRKLNKGFEESEIWYLLWVGIQAGLKVKSSVFDFKLSLSDLVFNERGDVKIVGPFSSPFLEHQACLQVTSSEYLKQLGLMLSELMVGQALQVGEKTSSRNLVDQKLANLGMRYDVSGSTLSYSQTLRNIVWDLCCSASPIEEIYYVLEPYKHCIEGFLPFTIAFFYVPRNGLATTNPPPSVPAPQWSIQSTPKKLLGPVVYSQNRTSTPIKGLSSIPASPSRPVNPAIFIDNRPVFMIPQPRQVSSSLSAVHAGTQQKIKILQTNLNPVAPHRAVSKSVWSPSEVSAGHLSSTAPNRKRTDSLGINATSTRSINVREPSQYPSRSLSLAIDQDDELLSRIQRQLERSKRLFPS